MARVVLEVIADDKASKALIKMGASAKKTEKGFKGMGMSIVAVNQALEIGKKVWGAFGKVISVVGGVIADLTSAAAVQEEVEKKFLVAIRQRSEFTDEAFASLNRFNTAVQQSTGIGDEQLLALQGTLAALGVTPDRLEDATKATIGFAQVTGNLTSATTGVAKAFAGNVDVIRRYGFEVKDANDVTKAMIPLFKIAQESSKTFSGQLTILQGNFGDLKEDLGKAFLPALKLVFETGSKLILGFRETVVDSQDALTDLATVAIRKAVEAFTVLLDAVIVVVGAFVTIKNAIDSIPKALDGMVGAMARAVPFLGTFISVMDTAGFVADRLTEAVVSNEETLRRELPALFAIRDAAKGLSLELRKGISALEADTTARNTNTDAVKRQGKAFVSLRETAAESVADLIGLTKALGKEAGAGAQFGVDAVIRALDREEKARRRVATASTRIEEFKFQGFLRARKRELATAIEVANEIVAIEQDAANKSKKIAEERATAVSEQRAKEVASVASAKTREFEFAAMNAELQDQVLQKQQDEALSRNMETLETARSFANTIASGVQTVFQVVADSSATASEKAKAIALEAFDTISGAVIQAATTAVTANATSAAAGAASAVAGIPIVGPVLAVAAMATIFAVVRGLLTNLAEGGLITGGTPGRDSVPAMLMPGELVLPVPVVRSIAKTMGMSSGGQVAPLHLQGGGVVSPAAQVSPVAPVTIQFQSLIPPDRTEFARIQRDVVLPTTRQLRRLGHKT